MLLGAGGAGTIEGNLDIFVDETLGVIRHLAAFDPGSGAPEFVHGEARLCNPAALGGVATRAAVAAASTDRAAALRQAAAAAVSHYSAALYQRDALPLASFAEADFDCVRPADFALFSQAQYARPGFPYVAATDDAPLRWAAAADLATGEAVHVPAAFAVHPFFYHRRAGDMPIAPSNAAGLVCAEGATAAALAGLTEIVRQDAMAIFWQAMVVAPRLVEATLTPALRDLVGRLQAAGDRVFVLDVTTDNAIPAFVAILASDDRNRPAFVLDAGADLDAETAIVKALARLAETRRQGQAAMRRVVPATPANDWEDMTDPVDHLVFAADHANKAHFDFALSSDLRRDLGEYEPRRTGSPEADLQSCVRLIAATGHRACLADLTSDDIGLFGIKVCRALIPGYLPLHATHRLRALGGRRLYEVPQRLGYRGIDDETAANPAPHPFAC